MNFHDFLHSLTVTISGLDQNNQLDGAAVISLPWLIEHFTGKIYAISISSAHISLEEPNSTPFFKIEIENVYDDFCPTSERQIAGLIPNQQEILSSLIHFEPTHQSFHRLVSNFNTLTVRILDSQNTPVKLSKDHPTILSINIAVMDQVREYHLKMSGNPQEVSYLEGLYSTLPYRVQLQEKGTWKMALSSIFFPNPKLQTCKAWVRIKFQGEEKTSEFNLNDIMNPIFGDEYMDIGYDNADLPIIIHLRNIFYDSGILASQVAIMPIIRNSKLCLQIKSYVDFEFEMSKDLAYVLGDTSEGYLNAGGPYTIQQGSIITFDKHISINRRPLDTLMLTCDIIEPSMINNKFRHILKIVPVKRSHEEYLTYEPARHEFHDITPSNLEAMNFKLMDMYEQIIKIDPEKKMFINVIIKQVQ